MTTEQAYEVLSFFKLKNTNVQIIPFGDGLINQTFKVTSNEGDYILQEINDKVFKNPLQIENNVNLISIHLAKHYPNYYFVSPVNTGENKHIIHHQGMWIRLMPFVPNAVTFTVVSNTQQAFEAAAQFAQFTSNLAQIEVEKLQDVLPNFHNLSLRYQQYTEALANGNKERIAKAADLVKMIEENKYIVDEFEAIQTNTEFKKRVMHHDTKISNVLFDGNDKGLCVIDLDTVMPGLFISDVGDMIRTYVCSVNEEEQDLSKIEFRPEFFKAIVEGYNTAMGKELTTTEKQHFVFAGKFIIYMQSLRFIADYFNNDVYYKTHYTEQNYNRAANQLTLLKQLLLQEKELINIQNNICQG